MVLRFADFELDVEARALRRAGAPLPLEPRAFDLLVHLARNAERVIRHDELLRRSTHYRRIFARYDIDLPPLEVRDHGPRSDTCTALQNVASM